MLSILDVYISSSNRLIFYRYFNVRISVVCIYIYLYASAYLIRFVEFFAYKISYLSLFYYFLLYLNMQNNVISIFTYIFNFKQDIGEEQTAD